METHFIYVLLCPDTGKVRYVGRTFRPHERILQHKYGYGSAPVDVWKRTLLAAGKRATFKVIEEVNGGRAAKWQEHWWIRYFRRHEQPILNINTISPRTAREIKNPRRRYKRRRSKTTINLVELFDLSALALPSPSTF